MCMSPIYTWHSECFACQDWPYIFMHFQHWNRYIKNTRCEYYWKLICPPLITPLFFISSNLLDFYTLLLNLSSLCFFLFPFHSWSLFLLVFRVSVFQWEIHISEVLSSHLFSPLSSSGIGSFRRSHAMKKSFPHCSLSLPLAQQPSAHIMDVLTHIAYINGIE